MNVVQYFISIFILFFKRRTIYCTYRRNMCSYILVNEWIEEELSSALMRKLGFE